MTPTQKLVLENANVKDFILVERSPTHWFLLFIAKFDVNPLDGVRILVKPLLEPTRQDLWKYQHYGTWMFEISSIDVEPGPMSVLVQQQDIFTLNPSVEKLRALMDGECLYGGCEDGLVKTTVYTNTAVPWRRSLERIMANDAGLEPKTLCPFCMGWQLFERHEFLANMWNTDRYPLAVTRQHIQAVNAKRDAMGYEWLLPGIQLSTLAFRSQTGPPTYSARGQRSASGSPALSTHLFGWFKHAKERVLDDGRAICREPFQDGERIADLPCEHFFHERCVKEHFSYIETSPTCPLCQHAVALQ